MESVLRLDELKGVLTYVPLSTRVMLRAAKRQKVSRSRFYAKAVAAYLKSEREKGIREALDAVYGREPSEPDPFVTAAAYNLLAKEKW